MSLKSFTKVIKIMSCIIVVQTAHIFPAVFFMEIVVNIVGHFINRKFVNKLILDTWCILYCFKIKQLQSVVRVYTEVGHVEVI